MEKELKLEMTFEIETLVTEKNTALALFSGSLDVFATPCMIAVMERTARDLVAPYLEEGFSTVGTEVNVKHLKSTPIGVTVKTIATLIEIDNNKLLFNVEAYDNKDLIGKGTHGRHIINMEKFMERTNAKKV